jgi:hypothetical protein
MRFSVYDDILQFGLISKRAERSVEKEVRCAAGVDRGWYR